MQILFQREMKGNKLYLLPRLREPDKAGCGAEDEAKYLRLCQGLRRREANRLTPQKVVNGVRVERRHTSRSSSGSDTDEEKKAESAKWEKKIAREKKMERRKTLKRNFGDVTSYPWPVPQWVTNPNPVLPSRNDGPAERSQEEREDSEADDSHGQNDDSDLNSEEEVQPVIESVGSLLKRCRMEK